MDNRLFPRLVRDDDEPPVVVHASPGLLMQFAMLCFSIVSLALLIASSLFGFLQDATYQAGAAAGRLGGQDV